MVTLRISAPGLLAMSHRLARTTPRQFEKAVKDGTTRTARKYIEHKKALDRPREFTKRGYDYDKADSTGRARVFIRPIQTKYLAPMECGGTVVGQGKRLPLSINDSLKDRFGNLRGRGIRIRFNELNSRTLARNQARLVRTGGNVLARGTALHFVGKIKDKKGAFARKKMARGWKIEMLIRFLDSVTYRPTLNFRRDAQVFGQRNFGRFVNENIGRVLARRR